LNAISPVHFDNLVQGGSTYGFNELLNYMNTTFSGHWDYLSIELGLGMGTGLIIASFGARLIFLPTMIYAQMNGVK